MECTRWKQYLGLQIKITDEGRGKYACIYEGNDETKDA